MRGRIFSALFALAMLTGLVGLAPAAQADKQVAWTGWVYVVYGSWNCPNGGKVVTIQAANGGLWSTNWDWGDDIIYPNVYMGQSNTLNANLYCDSPGWGRPGMYYYAILKSFTPTANNQTFWL